MFIIRVIMAIVAMALGAAAVLALPGFSPEVEASAPAAVQKAERTDVGHASVDCRQQAWPYYGRECLRDSSKAGLDRPIRVIAIDRTR